MASEDISAALSIMRVIKEHFGIIFGLFTAGSLFTYAKVTRDRINERLGGHDKRLDDVEKDIQTIRENWVTEEKLEKILNRHSENTVNKVLVAVGAERRQTPR